jgi:methyl-accepting chemotaxis protein
MKSILRFNDWPLTIKLSAVMIFFTLIFLVVGVYVNALSASNTLTDTINRTFEDEAHDVSVLIANSLRKQANALTSLETNATIINGLNARNASYRGAETEILEDLLALDDIWRNGSGANRLVANTLATRSETNSVTPILHRFRDIFGEHTEIFVTDIRGGTLGTTNMLPDYYQADEEWWQTAYNNGEGAVFISDPIYDVNADILGIQIAVPIFSESDQGELLGIVRSTVDIEALTQELALAKIGDTGRAELLDKNGRVILDSSTETPPQFPDSLVQLLLSPGATRIIARDETGERSIFGVAELPTLTEAEAGALALQSQARRVEDALAQLRWRVVVRANEAAALAPVTATTRLALGTVLVAIAVVGWGAYGLSRLFTRQVEKIQLLFKNVNAGNFDARVEVLSNDELGQMARNLNGMLDTLLALVQTQEERNALQASIEKLRAEVADVAEGDLTVEAEITPDLTGPIADSFNIMIAELRNIISNVQEATVEVSTSANEIRATTEFLAQGSETQAAQIVDTAAAIDEMTVAVQQVSHNATISATVAEQAQANAKQGAQAVRDTIEGMNRIRDQVQETAKRIKRLGERAQEIGEIVQVIREIAKRTSILALNASLEAATAGEAGRGFAVVAEDVKRLAERSTNATRQIADLIQAMQNETNEAVAAMEDGTREVVEGSQLANQAGHTLDEIETVSNRLAELIQSISQTSQQQARGSESVARSMGEIADVTQQTAAGTKQTAVLISRLAGLADGLRASVSTFKLPNGNGHVAPSDPELADQ